MITTNKDLFNQDGSTFKPEFFLKINIWDRNSINVNITNLEGTNLDHNGFGMEHTQEVKDFIAYVSEKAKDYINTNYPGLDDLEVKI
jgi:hypothetical protein